MGVKSVRMGLFKFIEESLGVSTIADEITNVFGFLKRQNYEIVTLTIDSGSSRSGGSGLLVSPFSMNQ